jgi:hypothetical protein
MKLFIDKNTSSLQARDLKLGYDSVSAQISSQKLLIAVLLNAMNQLVL